MKRMKLLLAGVSVTSALLVAVSTCQAYQMVWESNYFNGSYQNWTLQQNNFAYGNNVDYSGSANAGGSAGELGGVFARHQPTAYFGRPLDFTVTLNDPLHYRGIFSWTNTYRTANSSVYIGYYDSVTEGTANYLAWRTREPSGGGTNPFRSRARINIAGNGSNLDLDQVLVQGTSYTFDLQWIPSGNNNGTGTWITQVGGVTKTTVFSTPVASPNFDMFGVFWDESADDPNVRFDAWFDNLEYLVPVPEPSAAVLVMLGGGLALWLRRRVQS